MNLSTELDAINVMLQTIGEQPINRIDGELPSDAATARTILLEVSRELQQRGWYWNTDTNYPLTRDEDNHIAFPPNAIQVDFCSSYQVDPVQRGSTLYDRKSHSTIFSADLKASRVIWFLPFDQLPESARRYASIRAARVFQDRYLGSQEIAARTQEEEQRAWALMLQDELRVEKPSLLDGPVPQGILWR